jgi:cellulose synthase/poly-beta-1,6-N-acetylglucosamine synthase-like glycosyltransferase
MDVTVGIPTWNRAALLAQTLAAVAEMRIPGELTWEVIVCDNNSTDATRAVVERAAARLPVRYCFEAAQGTSHAQNRLVAEALGTWLIFIDDDIRVEPDWLEEYVRAIRRYHEAACLGGPIGPWLAQPLRGRARYLLETFPCVFGLVTVPHDYKVQAGATELPLGGNMAFRRDVLVGEGFNTRQGMMGPTRIAGQETDRIRALVAQGREVWLLARPKASHYIPLERSGLGWFCRWHMGAGRRQRLRRGPVLHASRELQAWLWKTLARYGLDVIRNRQLRRRLPYYLLAKVCMLLGWALAETGDAGTSSRPAL